MLFSSPVFFLFFFLFLVAYTSSPPGFRLYVIIIGSTIFYAYWNIYYALVPHTLMLLAYFGALWVSSPRTQGRRLRLAVVATALIAPLAVVKYSAFFYNSFLALIGSPEPPTHPMPLPLGISFVTFTLIAYVVDVYRGRYPLQRRVSSLAGLVLFFPHLIAGPILRPADLLPQFQPLRLPRRSLAPRLTFGITIFTVGLFKKLVIADPLAAVVQEVFNGAGHFSVQQYVIAVNAFAAQIYCDFSGYTDMAIATAMMIGIRLPENFRRPYLSSSLVEFWRRWHITLSTWLRDYLYIPLGGNRRGFARQIANLIVTMALGGLWHGANWTFVVWGLMHGGGLAVQHAVQRTSAARIFEAVPRWCKMFATYLFVLVAWVWFRASDIDSGVRILSGTVTGSLQPWQEVLDNYGFDLVLLLLFAIMHPFDEHRIIRRAARRLPMVLLWPAIVAAWILALTVSQTSSAKFVYFDF
jgi:alginate O-acetyltransferase complex protein AlgI